MRPIKLVFAFAFVLLFETNNFVVADDRSHLSSDPRVNNARLLIEDGQFREALSILRPLVPDHADQTDVLFLVGLAALRASRLLESVDEERSALLKEAVMAFHEILIEQPELVRVRLELARALYLKGDDDLAREHFERVLAGRPPREMAANILRHLDAIRARRRWSGYIGIAVAPDSNINSASDAQIIYIQGLPFRRDADAGARSGLGVVLWGGGEYQYPLRDRMRLRAGVDISQREYAGRGFDQTVVSTHAGPRWLVDSETEISFLGSVRSRWAAGKPYSNEVGVRLEIGHRFTRQLSGNVRASWHRRRHSGDEGFNGPHAALSLGGTWQISPTMRAEASVGYSRERPRSLKWRNSSQWARLDVTVALPHGFSVGGGGELHRTRYEGEWFSFTPGGDSREDRTRVLRISVFNRAFTLSGFSPKLTLVNEARTSNAQLYGYRRNRAELQFLRLF